MRARIPPALFLCAVYTLLVLIFYWQTTWSIVAIWMRAETYAHGFLVVPIVLWLIWRKRQELSELTPRPSYPIQLLLIPGGLAWLLSFLADVLVIQQLALVGTLVAGIWSIIGHRMMRLLVFPMGFLFLVVPMGEDLVPPMMEITATSTVWLVEATGIPVYREGLHFTLPSGSWSVVEACSGVRYLIASFTLGLLYAHLSYRSLGKKVMFVLASILVPVLANSARAFIIVMLGHLSSMKLATGVDHLIYGWVFFGLVMLMLFWIGSYWSDDVEQMRQRPVSPALNMEDALSKTLFTFFFSAVLLAVAWPIFAKIIDRTAANTPAPHLTLPPDLAGWERQEEERWSWAPPARGADVVLKQFYQRGTQPVALYVQQYIQQKEGAELISGRAGQFIETESDWRIVEHVTTKGTLAGREADFFQVSLEQGYSRLLLWYWYRIGDRYTANRYVAKAYEAVEALFGRRQAALIVVATELDGDRRLEEEAREILQSFVVDYLPAIEASLDANITVAAP